MNVIIGNARFGNIHTAARRRWNLDKRFAELLYERRHADIIEYNFGHDRRITALRMRVAYLCEELIHTVEVTRLSNERLKS